jgi:uncharacterized membrane protein YbhN (UPF0104 family)
MVLWGLQKASAGVSFDAMVAGTRATSPTALLESFAATFLSFIAFLGYDLSGLRYAGVRPPFKAALLASFCGLAIAIIAPSVVAILLVGLVPARRDVSRRSFS